MARVYVESTGNTDSWYQMFSGKYRTSILYVMSEGVTDEHCVEETSDGHVELLLPTWDIRLM